MKIAILAGGSGTRLWPLSRRDYPKQFIKINSEYSFFQNTISRCLKKFPPSDIIVSAHKDYKFHAISDLTKIMPKNSNLPHLIFEPVSKNTFGALIGILNFCLTRLNLPDEEVVKGRVAIIAGSYAWRQGMYWKYIPPPYNQDKPITLPRGVAPKGAKIGGRTPAQTIQMIGQPRGVTPKDVSIDLGIVDAFITAGGTQINFTGKGQYTDVGTRLPSPTQGMSIGGYPGMPVYSGFNRPKIIKKKPKKRRKNEFSDIMEVRGGIR